MNWPLQFGDPSRTLKNITDSMEEVRKDCPTPALALSGFGMEEDVLKCRMAGFEGHLTKPVSLQKLEAAIWQLTGSN
jgi:CheY-like chemotaxis protein